MNGGMKKLKDAEDYIAEHFSFVDEYETWKNIIKDAQRDAIEYALDVASKNADAQWKPIGWLEYQHEASPFREGENYEVYVINSSILTCKDEIFKENNL